MPIIIREKRPPPPITTAIVPAYPLPPRHIIPPIPIGTREVLFEREPTTRIYQLVEDVKRSSFWLGLSETGYQAMRERLVQEARKIDLKIDLSFVPCIVEESEGKTLKEQGRIRRAHRVFVSAFARFLEMYDRFRPESKHFAVDDLRDEIELKRMLWLAYECQRFRTPETSNKGQRKK